MRITRKKKYKKSYKVAISFQIFIIIYATSINASIITTTTEAQFSNSISTQNIIQAGQWYDGSQITFVDNQTQNLKACTPIEISVRLKNKGFSMIDSTTYEVYYSNKANGNPKQTGSKIAEGVLNPLAKDEIGLLKFKAEQDGAYMFKIYQRPDFKETKKIKKIEWSEKILVNCNVAKQEDVKETKDKSITEIENEQPKNKKDDSTINKNNKTTEGDGNIKQVEKEGENDDSPEVTEESNYNNVSKASEKVREEEGSNPNTESHSSNEHTEKNQRDDEETNLNSESETENQDQTN